MNLLSRSEYYADRKNLDPAVCVLCNSEQIVLASGKHWDWVAAKAPYWKYHTMLVPKRHITMIGEINPEEWEEFIDLHNKITYIYDNSSLTMENGEPLQNVLIFWRKRHILFNKTLQANNVDHLHIHFACDREHFLDPISDEHAALWDVNIFRDKIKN